MKKALMVMAAIVLLGVAGAAVAGQHRWGVRERNAFASGGFDGRQCPYFSREMRTPQYPEFGHGYPVGRMLSNRGFESRSKESCPFSGARITGRFGAQGSRRSEGRAHGKRYEKGYEKGHEIWKNVPEEMRAKMVEVAKLRIDLHDVLTRDSVDRAKALEIHGKISALGEELGTWHFNRMLDDIEKRDKEAELNKKVPAGKVKTSPSE